MDTAKTTQLVILHTEGVEEHSLVEVGLRTFVVLERKLCCGPVIERIGHIGLCLKDGIEIMNGGDIVVVIQSCTSHEEHLLGVDLRKCDLRNMEKAQRQQAKAQTFACCHQGMSNVSSKNHWTLYEYWMYLSGGRLPCCPPPLTEKP